MSPRPDPERERELIARARRGGPGGLEAFDGLVRLHHPWLLRLLLYATGSVAEADDLAQEVFVKAWQDLPTFRGDALRPWLRVIALRRAWNRRRDTRTRERYHEASGQPRFVASCEEDLAAREVLMRVLDRLPHPYREVLVLRHVEELPHAEIAEVLGISPGAARMRLKRARDAFWSTYEEVTRG